MSQLELFTTKETEPGSPGILAADACPYCEKERSEVNSWGSIDNEFDYSCAVCNLEYLNWKDDKDPLDPYKNKNLQRAVKVALETDRKNNETEWKSHLKTIAERSEIFQPKGN